MARRRWFGLLIAGLMGATMLRADTVKLKDGTVLEGEILSENVSNVAIHLEFSGGTISQTRTIDKADVATITRWTPEEKHHWQAERDYQSLNKFQLNPDTSFKVEYYDQTISNVFRKFLTQYPDSSHVSNISERIVLWRAERERVAGGKMKFHGQWLNAADAMRAAQREQAQQAMQAAHTYMARGQPEAAVQQLRPVVFLTGQPDLVAQARPLLVSAYQQASTALERERQRLEAGVAGAQQRATQAQQALNQADAARNQAAGAQQFGGPTVAPNYQAIGANQQAVVQAQMAQMKARSELNVAQNNLQEFKSQLAAMDYRISRLKSQTPSDIVAGATSDVQTAKSPAPASTPSSITSDAPSVIVSIVAWLRDNWVVMVVVLLLIVFALSQYTKS